MIGYYGQWAALKKLARRVAVGVVVLEVVYLLVYFIGGALAVIDPDERRAAVERWKQGREFWSVKDDDWPVP